MARLGVAVGARRDATQNVVLGRRGEDSGTKRGNRRKWAGAPRDVALLNGKSAMNRCFGLAAIVIDEDVVRDVATQLIAIVEDEPAIRDNYAAAFQRHGYSVRTYGTRKEAIEAFRARLPDLAVIDVGLHDEPEGGFELCRELRAMSAELPIICACDMLFVDTLHTGSQVAAELKHAHCVRKFLVFHDVNMFGWRGEQNGDGILPAIFDFMAQNHEWVVHAYYPSQWGMLALRRR